MTSKSTPSNYDLETGLFARMRAWLFGYDVFISYKRSDSHGYALALQRALEAKNLKCFRDISELPAGDVFALSIERALRRSRMLVVIGTPKALSETSGTWVRRELTYFQDMRPKTPIVIVNVENAANGTNWPEIKKYSWLDERQSALNPPEPGRPVVDGIDGARTFPKVNRIARYTVAATCVALLSLLAATAISVTKTAEQQRIARATELAANADVLRESDVGAIDRSARLAVEAVQAYKGVTTDRSLREAAKLLSNLRASIEPPCGVQYAAISPNQQYLAIGRSSKACVVDLQSYAVVLLGINDNAISIMEETDVKDLSFTPDGKTLLALHGKPFADTAKISAFAAPDWGNTENINVDGSAVALRTSPDGKYFVVGTFVGELFVDNRALAVQTKIRNAENEEKSNRVRRIEFAGQDNMLVTELDSGLEVWSGWNTPMPRKDWEVGRSSSRSGTPFAIDRHRNSLFVAREKGIEIIDLETFAVREELAVAGVEKLAFTEVGVLFAETRDKQIHSWHAPVEKFVPLSIEKIRGESPFGGRMAPMRSGELVLATRGQAGASVFAASGSTEVARMYYDETLWHAFELIESGDIVTASDKHVRIWGGAFENRGGIHLHGAWMFDTSQIAVSPNGKYAAVARARRGLLGGPVDVEVWDIERGERLATQFIEVSTIDLAIDDHAERVVIVSPNEIWEWSNARNEGGNLTLLADLPPVPKGSRCRKRAVAQSGDGQSFIVSGDRGELWQWNANDRSFSQLSPTDLKFRCADALELNERGDRLAMSHSTTLSVIDVVTQRLLFDTKTNYVVRDIALSQDGEVLTFGSGVKPDSPRDGPIAAFEVWSVNDKVRLFMKRLDARTAFPNICMNRNGDLVVTAVRTNSQLWAVNRDRSGATLQSVLSLPEFAESCRFSSDDKYLFVSGYWGLRRHFVDVENLVRDVESRLAHK